MTGCKQVPLKGHATTTFENVSQKIEKYFEIYFEDFCNIKPRPTTRADEGCARARTRANLREIQLAYAPSAPYSCTKSLPFSHVRAFGAAKAARARNARASIRARYLGSDIN